MEPAAIQSNVFETPDHYQRAMLGAWEKFTTNQQLDPIVPPLIAASWRRSWGRVNPNHAVEFIRMGREHLLASQTASFDLMAIARPVMEDVYQCVQNSGTTIILTNSVGCILDLVGDEDIIKIMEGWGAGRGTILSEELIGTTSVGLVLTERMPVQVAGTEHFVRQFHVSTGAAAPIFDISGRLLGVLGLVMPADRYHIHSLGLVAAAARAVENQHQSDLLMGEQNSQLAQLNTILSTISDGILVLNTDHVVVHANHAASQMLGIPAQSMVGKPAGMLFTMPAFVEESIRRRKPLTDVEGVINVSERMVSSLISVDFVFRNPDKLQWIIVTVRSEKKVRKLIQQQVGATASLTLNDIPGEAPQMQRVRSFVRSAAGAQASILIRGEVGTGKNALASAIHNAGPRHDGPFVIFASASVPNELVISDLLGYDESMDNNRASGRPSKFELAQGGTLFFQDVDALPLEAQTVLINALELGVVQRLESQRAVEVEARIIASTSADMETLIAHGSFRPDLYYRLSTFTITLPPLRNRPRDIPLVAERILTRFTRQLGYQVSLAPEVMDAFRKYAWPGNIREMEAVLGRAATQVIGAGVIGLAHIPNNVRLMEANPETAQPFLQVTVSSLSEMERETILLLIQRYRGNISRMAQVLDISRTTLWRKLKDYGVDPDEYR
ncbi:MAG TPA: sigma 54-interacting transcriptional regulator [Anaerolineales bacterium]|nr:sigma 54-interacting transcriptional regulator [Anaerolineales bacterium]